jgi:hypothetical protein
MVLKRPVPSVVAGMEMVWKALADEHEGDLQINKESLPPKRRTVMATCVALAGATHTQGLVLAGRGSGTEEGP